MAGSSRTVELKYRADITQLTDNLSKIPGLTEKEAKAMVKALDRNLKKAEKQAKKTAANSSKEWKKFGDRLGKVAKGAAATGAAFMGWNQILSDTKNELLDMSNRTGISAEMLAGIRLAAEGSGQEFGNLSRTLAKIPKLLGDADRGVVLASDAFADLGVATHDASGKLRDSDSVIRDVMKGLGSFDTTTERAAKAANLLGASGTKLLQSMGNPAAFEDFIAAAADFGVNVGPGAAEAADRWQREMAGLKSAMWGAADSISASMGQSGAAGVINDMAAGIVYLGTTASGVMDNMGRAFGGTFKVLEALWLGVSGNTKEAKKLFDELHGDNVTDPMESMTQILDRAAAKMGKYQRAQKRIIEVSSGAGLPNGVFTPDAEGAKASAENVKDLTSELDELAALRGSIAAASQTEADKIDARFDNQIAQINKLAQKLGESDDIAAARAEVEKQYLEDHRALRSAANQEDREEKAATQEAIEKWHAEDLARIEERKSQQLQAAGVAVGGISEALAAASELQSEAQGVAAQRLFTLSKGAAIGEIAINTAVAITKALAQLGPIAGPLAATGIGASGAAQAAVVSSQEMPSFHMGGVIGGQADGQVINALRGEAVLTRQAVSNIGVGAVNAMNSGQQMGGGPMPLPVYKHFDRFARDEVRRGGELRRAIRGKSRAGQRGY